jgi:hypothetical protein
VVHREEPVPDGLLHPVGVGDVDLDHLLVASFVMHRAACDAPEEAACAEGEMKVGLLQQRGGH